jgi:NADH:ubiquinone oxidoreductase subunit C
MLQPVHLNNKMKYFLLFFAFLLKNMMQGILVKNSMLFLFLKLSKFYVSLAFLKNNTISNFSSLLDIAVVDHVFCNGFRFELTYIFINIPFEARLGVKLLVSGLTPLHSVSSLFSSGDWLEREAWDMFGLKFVFHKGLRRILTDYGFKGYPLRKDFPLIGFFDLIFDDSIKAVKLVPVELAQSMRFYKCTNPWKKL